MVDDVQTALEGKPPMLREVQDDSTLVYSEADVFDTIFVCLIFGPSALFAHLRVVS